MASWERGRPARTRPGTAPAISPTWIKREQRHGSASAWPLLFPPTGWLPAASHGSSAAANGTGCGRDARAPRRCRGGCLAGDFSESRRAPFGKLPFARQASLGTERRRRRRLVRMAPHLHRLRMEFRPPPRPEVVWGRPQRHTVLCARLSPARRKSRNRRRTRRRLEGCPGSRCRWS